MYPSSYTWFKWQQVEILPDLRYVNVIFAHIADWLVNEVGRPVWGGALGWVTVSRAAIGYVAWGSETAQSEKRPLSCLLKPTKHHHSGEQNIRRVTRRTKHKPESPQHTIYEA